MATNSERPRRFDLRTTIPLATETLVNLAKQPKKSWVVPALTLITGIAFMVLMLELLVFPGPVSALAFEGGLRSRLSANYGADPVVARIHELRLTIVEDVLGIDEGNGSDPAAVALLLQDPVPTATPKPATPTFTPLAGEPTTTYAPTEAALDLTALPAPTDAVAELTASPGPVATHTDLPAPSETPIPPTELPVTVPDYCDDLSITSMWIHSDDEVRARVKNSGSLHAYLTGTLFEWPDVPNPAFVDWFRFDNKKYFSSDDWSSPTTSSGSDVRIKKGKTETWRVDFDDEPDEGVYGSFNVTLRFDVSGMATCYVSGGTYRDIPGPTSTPEPIPTDTPEPIPTDTPLPATDTPLPAPTNTPVPPTDTPVPPTDTPVPPTETPVVQTETPTPA